jgi:uncharacterized protein with GYD domain
MPHYLHQWTYKDREVRAMVTAPQDREDVVRVAVEAFGGKLHGFYFCFGEHDGACISEFPDNETALACLMSIFGQGGLATLKTTPLMTQEESRGAMERARAVVTHYQPPSGVGPGPADGNGGRRAEPARG